MGSATYACPKCGKSIKVSRGNNRDSARYADWCQKSGRVCRDCELASFRAEHDAKVTAAAANPANATLPALTGTEKQVAWATALRLEALPKIGAAVTSLIETAAEREELTEAARQEVRDALHLLALELRTRTDAREWIDGRFEADRRDAFKDVIMAALNKRGETLVPTALAEVRARREQAQATD